jgi:hypothetical protein
MCSRAQIVAPTKIAETGDTIDGQDVNIIIAKLKREQDAQRFEQTNASAKQHGRWAYRNKPGNDHTTR